MPSHTLSACFLESENCYTASFCLVRARKESSSSSSQDVVGGRRQVEIITLVVARDKQEGSFESIPFASFNSSRVILLVEWLTELDEKTRRMVKLIEQDADSFSQRAEVYYNKRPELINMVQDFYRIHCSLAESYDQLIKYECGRHLLTSCLSPLSLTKTRLRKSLSLQEYALYSHSGGCKFVEFDESSEVDDAEEEVVVEEEESSDSGDEEWTRLRRKLERLREENKVQKEELMKKDEEKRDVIRQLSFAMNLVMEESLKIEKCLQ